jgi:ribonucleoside-diphosphate reductase alpha chain
MTDRSSPMNSDAPTPPANGIAHVTSADVPFQPTSIDIWEAKYRLTDPEGNPIDKTMDDTHKRVARALADAEIPAKREEWYEKFLWALRNGAIGAGRITSNAGAQQYKPATSLINCVVSGKIEDSMDSIMTRVYEGAMTLRKGSGIGYDMSTMRPKGAFVAGAGASTSGPLSFMDIYDKMCFTVASAGGRRGAQMATFDVGHPDVLDFIRAKRESASHHRRVHEGGRDRCHVAPGFSHSSKRGRQVRSR